MAITFIVVAILTLLIFFLTWLAFHEALKSETFITTAADVEDLHIATGRVSNALKVASGILSTCLTCGLIFILATAVCYRVKGQQFSVNNQTALVVASNSMDGFANEEYQNFVLDKKSAACADQFQIGDILIFDQMQTSDDLILYDIYGYKDFKGRIILHRFVGYSGDGVRLLFRGDNAGGQDSPVKREQVILHYSGHRVQYVGNFVLFTQSLFGLYSISTVVVVYVMCHIYICKYGHMLKKHLEEIKTDEH